MSSPDFSANDLREKFLRFFEARGHKVIPPSSLVPENDPTVLFTTAGMQQLKKFYSNPNEAPSAKVVTIQPCVRTNDIEEVGDATHLTFFEMPGNFSFGFPDKENSYFKKEAIEMAWDFLTKELDIATNRIHATYFKGEKKIPADDESLEILEKIEALEKIESRSFEENFWSLGTENSPGGPTVEFYIDDVEIWNLVFNEYILRDDKYEPSRLKGVDTGMGLERLLAVLNGVDDGYRTELFWPIIQKIEEISGKKYVSSCHSEAVAEESQLRSFRIIADHIKAAVFILAEGVIPSNKLQGYILRRLIRRAIVKAKQIGIENNFCAELVDPVCHSGLDPESSIIMGKIQGDIKVEIEKEEMKFRATLKNGLDLLMSMFTEKADGSIKKSTVYGQEIFDLYQTNGVPPEVAVEELALAGIQIDPEWETTFNALKREHQEISRAGIGQFKGGLADAKEETTKLHTAAHLLHAALRKVLGEHILQRGSNITAERLRFDFSHPDKLTDEQISDVENLVNEQIQKNLPVEMGEMSVDEAKKSGALGVFDERYGNCVKVYSVGDFSKEICGGPHAKSTGDLGHFKITNEMSSSAGIRRIKAVLE